MIYVAWLVLFFTAIQLLVALINVVFRPKLNKTNDSLKPLISVLIPARNEESSIMKILGDLQHQNYQNLEIIVFDDDSSDRTAALVAEMAKYDKRISLIPSKGLPEGWLGKNNACHQMALQAKGEYLLFLDADVRIGENTVSATLHYLLKSQSTLLSIFPRQIMNTPGERMVVPIMNYILMTLLPLVLVRYSRFPSLSAANGQFMLFEAKTYRTLLPHELMKAEKVEDIQILRYFKKLKLRTACLAGNKEIRCRMYNNYHEALNGFSKNIIMFFGNSFILAILFWIITSFGFLAVLFSMPIVYFLLYLGGIVAIRIFVSIASQQSILFNLGGIIPQHLNMGRLIFKSLSQKKQGSYQWKGRSIS